MTADQTPFSRTQLLASIFCARCDFTFIPELSSNRCPRCGAARPGVSSAATQYLNLNGEPPAEDRTDASQRFRLNQDDAAELDSLLGQEFGRYHVEALLGSGAMGRVYLAKHLDLHRHCALKILPPRLALAQPDFVTRFMNEGRAAAALIHPNIVTVHAIGELRERYYLEMEFVAGRTLRELVTVEGPQAPVRALSLSARIADGLAAAHQKGILHRDLKLENVLLTYQGIPKIADFGLAQPIKPSHDNPPSSDVSTPSYVPIVGTPEYMAPELFRGEPASFASDVYALGVCLYELLTGQVPFQASSLTELGRRVQDERIPSLRGQCPHLPLEYVDCVEMLLHKVPANRPRSAIEATRMLEAILGGLPDLESLIHTAFARHDGKLTWYREAGDAASEGRYRLEMVFPSGRRQTAFIEPSLHAAVDQLVLISSRCGPARPEFYEAALRLNAEMQHGALAIRMIDGEPSFVIIDSYPRSTVDPEEIRRTVIEVAQRADAVEKLLTGGDVF